MEGVRSLLITVWDWMIANRDALIVEAISIAITVGLIEAVVRWREKRKWSRTRRQVAVDVGNTLWDVFAEIRQASGPSPAWDEVVPLPPERMRVPTLDFEWYNQTSLARFLEHEYAPNFHSKYGNLLCQMGAHELKRLSESMGRALATLNPCIDLARDLFGPDVVTALLELREQLRWTQSSLYYDYIEESKPSDRDVSCIGDVTSKMGRAITLLWDNVD